jgi:hypothetical protein
MQSLTAPAQTPPERPAAPRGRWIWRVSGVATVAALTAASAGIISHQDGSAQYADPMRVMTKSLTVPQPVTGLRVLTSGMPVQVTTGPGTRVRVTELIQYDPQGGDLPFFPKGSVIRYDPKAGAIQADPNGDGLPALATVSGKLLTLDGTPCDAYACAVSFAVTVPRGTSATLSTAGGDVIVSGTTGTRVDSGGGNVYAAGLRGPLSVSTGSGSLMVNGLDGPLSVDASGGSVDANALATPTATVITGGGDAWLGFTVAPGAVMTSTDGGGALIAVPAGPYALTADSGGGPQAIAVATDPAARRAISVASGGGPLQVEPPSAGSLPPIPPLPSLSAAVAFGPAGPPDVPAPLLPPLPPLPPGS